ncbi:MAG: S8 family serine peptidase [Alphaproteobacteria bacterium]|nr:S8 family serine peptidase [Alphaproteobacteria bacterium]MCB9696278.1 S8 family serine peptidase [Alphaproteobacteria bacterium]
MRSLLGLLVRGLLFWGVFGLLGTFGLLLGLLIADTDGALALQATCGFLRWSMFFAALACLAFEWVQLDRFVRTVDGSTVGRGEKPGGRPERWAFGLRALLVGWIGWSLVLYLRALWAYARMDVLAPVWAVGWTLATALVAALVTGRITLWSRRRVLRGIRRPHRPSVPAVFPLLTAGWNAVVLVVAFGRLPSLIWVEPLAYTAVLLASVLSEPPKGSASTEIELVVPWSGSSDELETILRANGASAELAVPSVSGLEDAELSRTVVVDVPTDRSLILLWQLAERGVIAEVNAPVALDADLEGGRCSSNPSGVVDDPLGVPVEAAELGWNDALLGLRAPRGPARIAVVDSGVVRHSDLVGALSARTPAGRDARDHGTGVASVAAAVTNNGMGTASTNIDGRFLEVLSYDVLARPRAAADDVADGITAATDDGARVIVLAFGARGPAPEVVRKAVAYAVRRDVVVVAAAGNGNGANAGDFWPANVPGVLVVGAVDGGRRPAWSNTTAGVSLAVSAPGEGVCVATADGGYERRSGTSYAAPLVAGLIGTYRALCPARSRTEVVQDLIGTARDQRGGLAPLVRADAFLGRATCSGLRF